MISKNTPRKTEKYSEKYRLCVKRLPFFESELVVLDFVSTHDNGTRIFLCTAMLIPIREKQNNNKSLSAW